MRVIDGGNFSWPRGVAYPIVVAVDTEYRTANFAQASPHTAGVFAVSPGVRLVLTGCNLVNVTVPDGAEVVGGNGLHGIDAPTGDVNRATVKILCECGSCCTYRRILNEPNLPRDTSGLILHHLLKVRARARRDDTTMLSDDRTWQAASNADAMARFGRTVTVAMRTTLRRGL